jgi:hypothetical protein
VAHLAKLARLREPGRDATDPVVKGATPPAGLPPLPGLALGGTRIGDAGLAHLRELRGLQRLELNNTQVTDAGLAGLRGLKGLRVIDVRGAKVTSEGIAAFQKALPRVRIIERP